MQRFLFDNELKFLLFITNALKKNVKVIFYLSTLGTSYNALINMHKGFLWLFFPKYHTVPHLWT